MASLQSISEFEAVFKQYYSMLCNIVRPMVGDADLAQDIVQEVMIHCWRKRKGIGEVDHMGAFLTTACRRKAIEHLRKVNNRKKLEQLISNTPTEEQELLDHEVLKEKIYNSIRQLPSKCGAVFTMSKINGLTYAEIAEELDISSKTVENHMSKAFKLLRQMLDGKIYDQ